MLLPHNIPVYKKLKEHLSKNKDAIIITATGTGKSYLVAEYIEEYNLNALVICPRRSLCKYWSKLSENVSPITYQYFEKHIDDLINVNEIIGFFDIFVFDEAHHAGAKKWGKAIEKFKEVCKKPIIGLTADPKRYTDGGRDVSIEIWDGSIVEGYTLNDSIGKILPNVSYTCALYDTNGLMENIPSGVSDKLLKQLEYSIKNTKTCVEILQTEISESFPHKGIVFVDRIHTIKNGIDIINKAFPNEKVWAIHSKQSEKMNDMYINEFNNSESGFIVAVDMLNEGIHISTVDIVIMLRKTSSPTIFFQQIGRGMSVNGKYLHIFDFVSNHNSLKITSSKSSKPIKLFDTETIYKRSEQSIIHDYSKDIVDVLNDIKKSLFNFWTEEEDKIIRKYYPIEGSKVAERLPGRTKDTCIYRAKTLKINSDKFWTKEEDEILKKYYPIEGMDVVKRLPGRTRNGCKARARLFNVLVLHHWTPEEDEILKKYYPTEGGDVYKRLPGRTSSACVSRASNFIIQMRPYWTEEEDKIIREYYPTEGSKVAERLPGRTSSACKNRAKILKVLTNVNHWTPEEDEILKKYYPTEGSKVAERLPNKTPSACKARANKLKIKRI